jgi:hypothetical protein
MPETLIPLTPGPSQVRWRCAGRQNPNQRGKGNRCYNFTDSDGLLCSTCVQVRSRVMSTNNPLLN